MVSLFSGSTTSGYDNIISERCICNLYNEYMSLRRDGAKTETKTMKMLDIPRFNQGVFFTTFFNLTQRLAHIINKICNCKRKM